MIKYLICILLLAIWIYILHVLSRTGLTFWHFITGSFGIFIFMMVIVRPIVVAPLSKIVASLAGTVGSITGMYSAYFKYGVLFINSLKGSVTLQIDFECSGVIEIMAFLSLLIFFRVYNIKEKLIVGAVGIMYIMLANAIRIIFICVTVYYGGMDVYYIAHAIVGRIIFYILSILLYFYVFTKPQIVRIQVGKFSYGNNKQSS